MEDAVHLREQLCALLKLAGMNLRKWRTSSREFRDTIPSELIETEDLILSESSLKTLGIHWNVQKDCLYISTPSSDYTITTKRTIASDSARVYDILGLFSPFIIVARMILQSLWKTKLKWDESVPKFINEKWQIWHKELPILHQHPIPRRYHNSDSPVIERTLHGFSDASTLAYGGVVYVRQLHQEGTITTALVMSKAKVMPIKTLSIPRAELAGAYVLAKLLVYVAKLLKVSPEKIHPWTDSSSVIKWMRKFPATLHTFVAHKVSAIQEILPSSEWKYVSTKDNPADLLSRGMSAKKLINSKLWWHGPDWLLTSTDQWPDQKIDFPEPPEVKTVVLTAISIPSEPFELLERYFSFNKLTSILTWVKRFVSNLKSPAEDRSLTSHITTQEIEKARIHLLKLSQNHTYSDVIQSVKRLQ